MEIQKKAIKVNRIHRAFLVIGMNIYRPHSTSHFQRFKNKRTPIFWKRDDLQFVLVDAKKAYIQAAKQNHPDKQGNHEQMIQINSAWKFIELSFKRKGFTLN